MKVAGLFAGIGGIELGLHASGHDTALLCEIMPAARAVLESKFKDTELVDDIRELGDLPAAVDVICAGFPCQDLSQAGQTKGLAGTRSSLVEEVFRLVRKRRPRWLVLENVPFMLQLGGGNAMRWIVDTIESIPGYTWAWRVVDSYSFGVPQRRHRVILVASRDGAPEDVLLADDVVFERPDTSVGKIAHGFYWTEGRGGLGWAPDAVPTLKNGSTIGIPSPPAILRVSGDIIKPDIRDAERMQGFEPDWTEAASSVGRASMRWSLVGNAVTVPVAKWLGERLSTPGAYNDARDRGFPPTGKLPRAARFDGKNRHSVAIGLDPLGIQPPHLEDFLRYPGDLLSYRAASGFLSRTRVAKLRFPAGFIQAVETHVARMAPSPTSEAA